MHCRFNQIVQLFKDLFIQRMMKMRIETIYETGNAWNDFIYISLFCLALFQDLPTELYNKIQNTSYAIISSTESVLLI